MKWKTILLLVTAVLLNLYSQNKSDPPPPKTYYVSEADTITGINAYNLRSIIELDSVLLGIHTSVPKATYGSTICFKSGERFFGQINLYDQGVNTVETNLTFTSYSDGAKPIIDGSIETFTFPTDCSLSEGVYEYHMSNVSDNIFNVYIENEELTLAREPDVDESTADFVGFNKINSTSEDDSLLVFNDLSGYSGGQIVFKSKLWNYVIGEILNAEGKTDLPYYTTDVALNYGYFVQDHISALDSDGEWYFDRTDSTLYFKTSCTDTCTVYVTGSDSLPADGGCGFYICNKGTSNYTIENLDIRNTREGIYIYNTDYVTVQGCDLSNALAGIDCYLTNYCDILDNYFINLNTWGLKIQGDNNTVGYSGYENSFRDIGLKLGYDKSLFFNPGVEMLNLEAIQFRGSNNNVSYNLIDNIGYQGILFAEANGVCNNNSISYNTIDSIGVTLADCGAIYAWHNFGTGNSISNNTITNCLGNLNGTQGYSQTNLTGHTRGIYMDELSCNMTIESNNISNCSAGIVLQNGRNNTVSGNTIENNKEFEMLIVHGSNILNGGYGNVDNEIDFYFSQLTSGYYTISDSLFYWNTDKKTLQNATTNSSATSTYVYVIPGNNDISGNYIGTSSIKNSDYFTFILSTWQEVNDNTLYDLTGDSLGISNNLKSGVNLDDVSVKIQSANVYDSFTEETYYVGYGEFETEFNDNELLNVEELELSIRLGGKVK